VLKLSSALYAGLLIGLVGLTSPSLSATPDLEATKVSIGPAPSKELRSNSQKSELAPHRALYSVKLGSSKNGGHVSDITGKMFFSLADDCHAWNIEQKMQVRFYYSEGEVSDNTSDLISRENKDGSNYVFYSRRKNDNDAPEILRGEANLTDNGLGKASYGGDAGKQIAFMSATTFPVHHTLELLKQARSGKNFFTTDVFDGADENGYNQISAFIGSAVAADTNKMTPAKAEAKSADEALTNQTGYPIRMAFFAPNNDRGSPDYEMDMVLLDNGVIKSMRVDYGDFSMTADLIKAESLPAAKCSSGT
jgi:hypothetical protein